MMETLKAVSITVRKQPIRGCVKTAAKQLCENGTMCRVGWLV